MLLVLIFHNFLFFHSSFPFTNNSASRELTLQELMSSHLCCTKETHPVYHCPNFLFISTSLISGEISQRECLKERKRSWVVWFLIFYSSLKMELWYVYLKNSSRIVREDIEYKDVNQIVCSLKIWLISYFDLPVGL